LLPCGVNSHADWALGVGMGKKSVVVGCPRKGERSPVYLWADAILENETALMDWLGHNERESDDGLGRIPIMFQVRDTIRTEKQPLNPLFKPQKTIKNKKEENLCRQND
jgi:hypothetical protein